MPPTDVLVPINAAFEERVTKLANEGKNLQKSMSNLAGRMIQFGRILSDLWDRAKSLDNDVESGAHNTYLMSKITEALGTDDKSIRSKWLAIGRQAEKLKVHQKFLPPQRDSLYELALAAKERKSIEGWINRNKLTPDSSVRDIRSLRTPAAKDKPKAKARGTRGRHLNAKVTLCFESYTDAAEVLRGLMKSDHKFEVESHQSFAEALRSELGDNDFEKISKRLR